MKTMVVPEISYISTARAQEMMDSFGKMLVTAYEVWRREKNKKVSFSLNEFSPEQLCEMFLNDLRK